LRSLSLQVILILMTVYFT